MKLISLRQVVSLIRNMEIKNFHTRLFMALSNTRLESKLHLRTLLAFVYQWNPHLSAL